MTAFIMYMIWVLLALQLRCYFFSQTKNATQNSQQSVRHEEKSVFYSLKKLVIQQYLTISRVSVGVIDSFEWCWYQGKINNFFSLDWKDASCLEQWKRIAPFWNNFAIFNRNHFTIFNVRTISCEFILSRTSFIFVFFP